MSPTVVEAETKLPKVKGQKTQSIAKALLAFLFGILLTGFATTSTGSRVLWAVTAVAFLVLGYAVSFI